MFNAPPPPPLSLSLSHGGRCLSVCSTRPVSQSLSRTVLLYVHRSDWDGGRGGGGRESEGSTADTARKRPERPWTAARTMEVLRRCPLVIAQRLVHCAIAVSTAVPGRVTRTMSVALLLRNNPKRKKSNFRSPAPPPPAHDFFCRADLRVQLHLPSLDLAWNPVIREPTVSPDIIAMVGLA